MILFVDGIHQGKLKLQFLNLRLNQKYVKQCPDLEHKLSNFLRRMELNLLGEVKLLKSYPNQHVHLLILELRRELNGQSKLMS